MAKQRKANLFVLAHQLLLTCWRSGVARWNRRRKLLLASDCARPCARGFLDFLDAASRWKGSIDSASGSLIEPKWLQDGVWLYCGSITFSLGVPSSY